MIFEDKEEKTPLDSDEGEREEEPTPTREDAGMDEVGFPSEVDFRKNLGCGG